MAFRLSRRGLLLGLGSGAATASLLGVGLAQPSEAAAVPDFRQAGDRDDTAAFARAIATGRPVYVPAGQGSGRGGEYLVGDVQPRSGTTIFGDGIGRTVVRQPDLRPLGNGFRGAKAVFYCDSGSPTGQIRNIRIRDMTLLGYVQERRFAEHNHLIQFSGVGDLEIERVEFKGFQGDGLILASSRTPGAERHNARVRVRDCEFDGINNENRNGISVIDGDGILIENCRFNNCTRHNMPGAVDFEPDDFPYAIIRDTTVRNCRFDNVGGNVATIAYPIPGGVRSVPTGITIAGNSFRNYRGTGFEIYISAGRILSRSAPNMAVLVSGNRGSNGHHVYGLASAKGVVASDNIWEDYARGSHFGDVGPTHWLRDAAISDKFVRLGKRGQTGAAIFSVSNLSLNGSEFIDCGDGGPNAYAIDFGKGRSEGVSLVGVRVSSPTGRTRHAVMKESTHRFDPATNRQGGNEFSGLPAVSILG